MMSQPLRRGEPYRAKSWRWKRFQFFVSSLLDRFPLLKRLLRYTWQNTRILRYKWRSKKLLAESGHEFDVDKICWVDPKRIIYSSLKEFDIYKDKGRVIEGNWDRLEKRFEDLEVYVAFKERSIEGKDWEDTAYYQGILDDLRNGKIRFGRSKSDLDRRCKYLDSLFQNIKNRGYKSQSEILSEQNTYDPMQIEDEITVNVGRKGDLLFNNGAHRLSIVKLLGIPRIPIKITVRHPQWVNFRRQILLYAKNQSSGKIYQPIPHPDLQDLPSFHDSESDRFNIIQKELSVRKGRLLDIGANWGYFCHKFEEIGLDCYAVEIDRVNVYFLEKLKRAENRHFKVIPESIFQYQDIENLYFDVVLALNIFHHFLKDKSSYLELINLLKKLNMKEMYFQPHLPNEPQMRGAYRNYSEEEFVEFILQNSKLNKAKFIGAARDGRKIYKLY